MKRANQILARVFELAPAQWSAYLEEACGEEEELRSLVDRLLESSNAPDFAQPTAAGIPFSDVLEMHDETSPDSQEPASPIGQLIGHISCWGNSVGAAWPSSTWRNEQMVSSRTKLL